MSATLIAVIGAVGVLAGAIVTGIFNKRKLTADASKIITDAAAGVVELLRGENTRVLAEVAQVRQEVVSVRQENEVMRADAVQLHEIAAVHASWDRQAFDELAKHGINLPTPPPLFAPARGNRALPSP